MQTSDAGVALIKQFEGLRLTAYRDAVGIWTIGYGHTSAAGSPAVKKGMTITAAEADAILRRDLERFEGYVASLVHVPLTDGQHAALVSFVFNLGPGNLKSSTLLRKLNAGDYQGAADQFPLWTKAGGKTLSGLVRRRAAERALFLTGQERPAAKPTTTTTAAAATADPAQIAAPVLILALVAAIILFAILS